MKKIIIPCLVFIFLVSLDGNAIDIGGVLNSGKDAFKAVTLSDNDVKNMARQAADYSDSRNKVLTPPDKYAQRLKNLTDKHVNEDGLTLNFKVYLTPDINAFAMADGTIRVYSGLMDKMDDNELLFVIGHEIGHVAKGHTKRALRVAYTTSAVRKGIALKEGAIGSLAASELGGFTEKLVNAQSSQSEEKEADDYGLKFMKKHGYKAESAVSALKKLAELGGSHSFLSTHPAPDKRAERIKKQL
jgi:putative metalloprotease